MKRVNWDDRIEKVKELGLAGQNMAQIGLFYGLSRQRIKQVVDRYIPDWEEHYGHAVVRKERSDAQYVKWGVKEDSSLYDMKRQKFRTKKGSSKGWEWTLTFGELDWPTHCPVLGIELDYFAERRQDNSVSFDRVDNSKGYLTGNVRIISWRANRLKNDGTAEEHEAVARWMKSLHEVPQELREDYTK